MNSASIPVQSTDIQNENRLTLFDYVLYVALVLSWSGSWYALALQVGNVAVQTSLFWRFVIAALIMWGWVALKGQPMRFARNRHLAFAGMGLFIFCLNFTLFYYGSIYLISGLLSVVFSLASVFNLLFGLVFGGRKPRLRVVVGACIGVAGITLMFLPELQGHSIASQGLIGLALCVSGTISFCIGSQISAFLQRQNVPVLSASAWGMSYGAMFSGLGALALGHSLAPEFSPVYLGSLIFLAVISSVIAFWAYLTLIGRIGAGRSGYATVMFPVLALVISSVFEGYGFPPVAIFGLVCVMAGNVLVLGGGKA